MANADKYADAVFHVQAAVWARLNLGSARNRAKIWDARDSGPVLVSSWCDLRFSPPVGFFLDAAQSHGRQSSFLFLSPNSAQRRARHDAGWAGRCQVSVCTILGEPHSTTAALLV